MHEQSYTMYIAEGIENKRKEQMEAKIKMPRVWVEVGKSRKTSVSVVLGGKVDRVFRMPTGYISAEELG